MTKPSFPLRINKLSDHSWQGEMISFMDVMYSIRLLRVFVRFITRWSHIHPSRIDITTSELELRIMTISVDLYNCLSDHDESIREITIYPNSVKIKLKQNWKWWWSNKYNKFIEFVFDLFTDQIKRSHIPNNYLNQTKERKTKSNFTSDNPRKASVRVCVFSRWYLEIGHGLLLYRFQQYAIYD